MSSLLPVSPETLGTPVHSMGEHTTQGEAVEKMKMN